MTWSQLIRMLHWAQRGTEVNAELECHGLCHDIPEEIWVCRGHRSIGTSAEWCRAKHRGVQKVVQRGVYRDTEPGMRGMKWYGEGCGGAQSNV